jgi:hypothetical protein
MQLSAEEIDFFIQVIRTGKNKAERWDLIKDSAIVKDLGLNKTEFIRSGGIEQTIRFYKSNKADDVSQVDYDEINKELNLYGSNAGIESAHSKPHSISNWIWLSVVVIAIGYFSFLVMEENGAEELRIVTADGVNVRAGPNGSIIRQVQRGEEVHVFERREGWGRIEAGEWISLDYVSEVIPLRNSGSVSNITESSASLEGDNQSIVVSSTPSPSEIVASQFKKTGFYSENGLVARDPYSVTSGGLSNMFRTNNDSLLYVEYTSTRTGISGLGMEVKNSSDTVLPIQLIRLFVSDVNEASVWLYMNTHLAVKRYSIQDAPPLLLDNAELRAANIAFSAVGRDFNAYIISIDFDSPITSLVETN